MPPKKQDWNKTKNFLDISFRPNWEYIPALRGFLQHILSVHFRDSRLVEVIVTNTAELVENATKYSAKKFVRLVIPSLQTRNQFTVMVSNFASPEQARTVRKIISEMRKYEPRQYFMEKMTDFSPESKYQSRIGLARIYFTSGKCLSASYESSGRLTLSSFVECNTGGAA